MADHDQRFKITAKEFFPEWMTDFHPVWAAKFELSGVEWLEQELFFDPPQGSKQIIDMVAKLKLKQPVGTQRSRDEDDLLALILFEVEGGDSLTAFRSRIYEYYETLRRRHRRPVLPMAMCLQVGLEGIGIDHFVETFGDLEIVRFSYLYVGLPGLDALQYLEGSSIFGVALSALMAIAPDQRAWLTAESLRRVLESNENAWRKHLLCDLIKAYAPLDQDQQKQLQETLNKDAYREVRAVSKTWFEEGMEKGEERGEEKGMVKGYRELIRRQLEKRFGSLPPSSLQRLQSWPAQQLTELGENVISAPSLKDLGLAE